MHTSKIAMIAGIVTALIAAPALTNAGFDRDSPPRQSLSAETVSGEISDVASGALTIKAFNGAMTTVMLDNNTTITIGGEKATAADLKSGQYAVVTTEEKSGQLYATVVSVRTSIVE